MSVRYRDSSGNETIVSGLTPGGDIEAGAMAERSGTVTIPSVASLKLANVDVVFSEPMPDADYQITLDSMSNLPAMGYMTFHITSKTAAGFTISAFNVDAASGHSGGTLAYTAFKTYTVQHAAQNAEDIANIKATIPSTASSTNKLATSNDVSNLNTSLGSRLDAVEDVIDATATITNKLVSQSTMQTAIDNVEIDVDDQIDATSENPVQNKVIKTALDNKENKQFTGTQAEWNTLTETQKKSYKIANITDDTDYVGNIVNTVTDGNMSAVTSNAVFNILSSRGVEKGNIYLTPSQNVYEIPLTGPSMYLFFNNDINRKVITFFSIDGYGFNLKQFGDDPDPLYLVTSDGSKITFTYQYSGGSTFISYIKLL